MCELVSVQEERQARALNVDTADDLKETVSENRRDILPWSCFCY